MLPERKLNETKKMDETFLHFEIIKQMVKFTMKVSLGTDKASLSKMTVLRIRRPRYINVQQLFIFIKN